MNQFETVCRPSLVHEMFENCIKKVSRSIRLVSLKSQRSFDDRVDILYAYRAYFKNRPFCRLCFVLE